MSQAAPLPPFDRLLACRGTWAGRNGVQVGKAAPVEESDTRIVVTPVLNDTFVRIDQTWAADGKPQSGSFLIGHDPATGDAAVHWVDTWHNGRRIMPLTGRFDDGGTLIAHGTFPAGDGPDWGWRIEIRADDETLRIDMACVPPGESDDGGVWTDLRRV